MSSSTTLLSVRFAETDQMGVAHHSSYVLWCEVGRVDWMKAHNMSYRSFEEDTGISLAVSELKIKYRQGVSFDDELTIVTTLVQAKSRRFIFDYQISSGEKRIADAQSIHTPTNRQGQSVRMPQEWLELLAQHITV